MNEAKLLELLDKAKELGADDIELYYESSEEMDIELYQGEVDSLESSHSKGLGIRVFVGGKMGFAYTANFNDNILTGVIKEAIANAEIASGDKNRTLPDIDKFRYKKMDIYNEEYKNTSVEDKIAILLDMEKIALDCDSIVKAVLSVSYGDSISEITIVNSKGLKSSYKSNICYAYLYVMAESEGEENTGSALCHGRSVDELTPDKTAKEAVKNAIDMLGGKQVESQSAPVVFDSKVGSMFMYVLSSALTADSIQNKRSLFLDKLNKVVAAESVNIIDDGTLEEGLATAPFDSEGVPCSSTDLIKDGVLVNYMYDTYTANKANVQSTGNAERGSYRGIPGVSSTNFYLASGDKSKEDIISGVDNGFYLRKVSGIGTGVNTVSGDFSLGATGQWIKNGKIVSSVREVTIAGNLIELLKGIEELGEDLKFNPMVGSFGSPTFKVKELAISGS